MEQDQGKYGQTIIDNGNNQDQGRYGDDFSEENQSGISQNQSNRDSWICPSCETVNYGATCEVCGFSKPSEDENSHVQQNKKTRASRSLVAAAVMAVLLIVGFFTVHFWTDGSCTEDSFCKLCGKIRTTAPGHQWNKATCTNAKYCEECGETEGTPLAHNWKAATCTELKTCRGCGKTEGTVLEHDWQAATCTQPATCIRCGLSTGTNSHTWTDNSTDVLKKCSLCMKQVEFFHNPLDGELLAWTEYEMINNRPANPVTYVVRDEEWVDWALIREGDLEISRSDKLRLLYVNDKIYYYVLRYCEIDDDIAYNLAITGRRYVNATRYKWETNKEFLYVDLTVDDTELLWGRTVGSAYAVFDADGTQYVIVRKRDTNKVYAVRSNWKN